MYHMGYIVTERHIVLFRLRFRLSPSLFHVRAKNSGHEGQRRRTGSGRTGR